MSEDKVFHPADTNGDGKVSSEEEAMYLEFKRKELEDADAMRDAQRNMTWFALGGLLLSFCCRPCISCWFGSSSGNTR